MPIYQRKEKNAQLWSQPGKITHWLHHFLIYRFLTEGNIEHFLFELPDDSTQPDQQLINPVHN